MWVQTDERIDEEERKRVGGFFPAEQTLNLDLKRKDNSNSALILSIFCKLKLGGLVLYLALNLRKLFAMRGRLKAGRLGSAARDLSPPDNDSLSASSVGTTCSRILCTDALGKV